MYKLLLKNILFMVFALPLAGCISTANVVQPSLSTSNNTSIAEDMLLIEAGSFLMGADDKDIQITKALHAKQGMPFPYDCEDERPKRDVYLDAFLIDRHELTVAQYAECIRSGACAPPKAKINDKRCNWLSGRSGKHPVNCVEWQQAHNYCVWAGKRLPTEAEWEKAARSSDGRLYPWGDNPPTCELAVWGDAERADGCGQDGTWPVCSRPQGMSRGALCDMAGNVWEWVSDWYADDYYKKATGRNPSGPLKGKHKIGKGGSWHTSEPGGLRCSGRYSLDPKVQENFVGFRCAKDVK